MTFKFVAKNVLILFPELKTVHLVFSGVKKVKNSINKMKLSAKIGLGSGVMFLIIIIFGWVAFPKILRNKIKGTLNLKPKSELRSMYLKVPFPLVFKVYVFNITNYLEVVKGDTPVLDEIGPYVFDEWKEKVDTKDNEDDDTLTYRMKDTWIFNKELSGGLTGEEIVTIPHPLIMGMVMLVAKDKPAVLNLLGKAINVIFDNPQHPFVTASVNDIFFNGLIINCTTNDFAAKAICTQLKTEAGDLEIVSETVYKFSIFGARNGSAAKKFKVKRGIENSHDLGKVIEFEDTTEMDIWPEDHCNKYEGTDSTIFPPFLTKEEGILSFAPDLCRSLRADFVEEDVYDGIPCFVYNATLGDMSTDPDMKCYCPSPTTCLKKGVFDLTKCTKVPIYASLPHFYDSDPSYVRGVRGLRPRKEDHGIIIYFESATGSPLSAKKRLQFSMEFAPVAKIASMKTLPATLVPMFWVEEGVDLNSTFTGQLKKELFRTLKIVKIVKWLLLSGSLAGLLGAGYLFYKEKSKEVTITPLQSAKVEEIKQKNTVVSFINSNAQQVNGKPTAREFNRY